MKKYWNQLSRPTRVIIFLTLIVLCAALTLRLLWIEPYDPEMVFRRMESAELIGPSRILAIVETPDYDYTHLVIAEDGDHVVLCGLSKGVQDHELLAYRPKQGEVTVYCAPAPSFPGWSFSRHNMDTQIPVVLLDNHPQATHAEITFTVQHNNFSKEFVLFGSRTTEGAFILPISLTPNILYSLDECYALEDFSRATGSTRWESIRLSIPVQVRLFNQAGEVIHEETVTVHSPVNQYLAEQESQIP